MRILQHSHPRSLGLGKTVFPLTLGFLSLSFQIFLMREFTAHFYGNEIAYGLILAAWLFWGGIGSILGPRLSFNPSRLVKLSALVVLLFPLSLVTLRFSRFILNILPGEITGLVPMGVFSFFLSLFISLPFGILFVFNVRHQKGDLTRVYLLESLGAALGGIAVYFLLIPFLSNWKGAVLCSALACLLIFSSSEGKKEKLRLVLVLAVLIAFSLFDLPSQKLYWKPFQLILSKDTPYGKLQAIKNQEQLSLYNNSLIVYSYPDLASSEESVHFALLQNPEANQVLLIGGGIGGGLMQVLKYPGVSVDYVELDPEIIRISEQILPEGEKERLRLENVQTFSIDGRAFVKRTLKKYDVVILNLPEPSTAQLNRFYTREFFQSVKERLTGKGILSFRLPSAENYISPELQDFLSSVYFTLREAFSSVEIVPGDTNIFLASDSHLSLDFEELGEKTLRLGLNNMYVAPHLLFSRLSPLRVELLREKVETGKKAINRDLVPVSYFYDSVLWSAHFQGIEKKMLTFFSQISSFWLLDFPLLLAILCLSIILAFRKRTAFTLVPLAVMGLTTIVSEIIIIIAFQTFYGYLYGKVALLLTSFMAGLFLGALRGRKRKNYAFHQILIVQFCFLLVLLLLRLFLQFQPPEISAYLFLLSLGFLGGDLFIVSNHLFLRERQDYGIGYGLDLLGSFIGALTASSILIPLVGLILVAKYLLLLNSFCFLFLVLGMMMRKR